VTGYNRLHSGCMLVDLIGLLVVTLMGWLGWRRGLLLSLLQIAGLAAGYLAAWTLYRPVGRVLGSLFSLQPLLSYPLGGVVAFVAGVSLFGVVGLVLRRRRRRRAVTPGTLDRVGGAALGGAHGLALVLVLAWAAVTLQNVAAGAGHAPDVIVRDGVVGRMALPLVVALARYAGAQTGSATMGEAAGSFARDPLRTTRGLSTLLTDARVQSVVQDRALVRRLVRDPKRAARDPNLRALARDPQVVQSVRRLGLLPPGPDVLSDAEVLQLTASLGPMARTIGGLADNAEVQRLVQDPQLQRLLQRRDLMALANDPTFNRLAEIVVQATGAQSGGGTDR